MIALTFFLSGSVRSVRREFPDDCTIAIGRADAGPDLVVLGDGPRFELRARSAHLSDDHALLTCRAGVITLEDRRSRNGTFVRLDPELPHPLDARPVRLGHDLVLVRDDPSRPVPDYLGHLSADAFVAWVRSHLGDRFAVELSAHATTTSLPLAATGHHLVVASAGDSRTLDAAVQWWLRTVVTTWNASTRPSPPPRPWRFDASSPARRRALDLARRAAATTLPVLLVGPAGSGRATLAQDLHDHGATPDAPFVSARCATLTPATLARLLDLADDGTLYLDELADLPVTTQTELLSRLSASPSLSRPLRLVAATAHDLDAPPANLLRDLLDRLSLLVIEVTAPVSAPTEPAPSEPAPSLKNVAPPATLGRLFADLVFLLAARDARGCSQLARRVHMTYQGADARLAALDVDLSDRPSIDAKIASLQAELRAHVSGAPAVTQVLRGVLDA